MNGTFNSVVRPNRALYISRGGGHVDLAGGQDILTGGRISVSDGVITQIDNWSGHYLPKGPEQAAIAVSVIEAATGTAISPNVYVDLSPE